MSFDLFLRIRKCTAVPNVNVIPSSYFCSGHVTSHEIFRSDSDCSQFLFSIYSIVNFQIHITPKT